MTDTVTRLMGLADVYADRFHEDRKRHTPETVHDRSAARIALRDELTRLFTPLSDGRIRACAPYGMQHMTDGVIRELARAVEKAHGIGGES